MDGAASDLYVALILGGLLVGIAVLLRLAARRPESRYRRPPGG